MTIHRAHLVQGVIDELEERLPELEELLGREVDPINFFLGFMAALALSANQNPHTWFEANLDDVLHTIDAMTGASQGEHS